MKALKAGCLSFAVLVASCAHGPIQTKEIPLSDAHIDPADQRAQKLSDSIPELTPFELPAPELTEVDLYSVVVTEAPVDDVLFALARDAERNIDIHPAIAGKVTLNAIDQTIEQILTRLAKQVDLRFSVQGNLITIEPDLPYLRTYDVNYLNIARTSTSEVSIATEVSSTGGSALSDGGGEPNVSNTTIQNESINAFWDTLLDNIKAILRGGDSALSNSEDGETSSASVDDSALSEGEEGGSESVAVAAPKNSIIANRETGLVTIRASQAKHREIAEFIEQVVERSQRQVIIEATIAEVTLNDDYQAGVDWSRLESAGDTGFSFTQNLLSSNLQTAPFFNLTYNNTSGRDWTSTVRLLDQFGNTKVLSSPKLMVMNNQTALLKVVENKVYFTTEIERDEDEGGNDTITVESTINTVPVGFVMSVTPQISDDNSVTLNARPTISRITGFAEDPGPSIAVALADADDPQPITPNLVPEIQVREVESILKLENGSIGVIGGLMQDTVEDDNDGVPGLSRIPLLGSLFKYENSGRQKTELVIFIRPIVVGASSNREVLDKHAAAVISSEARKPALDFSGSKKSLADYAPDLALQE